MVEVAPSAPGLEWDTPLYGHARTQLEQALPHAGIPEDVAERLRLPGAGSDPDPSGADGRRDGTDVPGLPGAALVGARADEGRHPLRPRRQPRRVCGARDVDDLEVRAPPPALRRREGRRALRPALALGARARPADPSIHRRPRPVHRLEAGHSGTGHGDERADDGLDDGHLLGARRPRRARDRDRQAALDRRLRLPARGDGRRGRDGDRACVRPSRLGARAASLRRPGLRQRRRDRRDRAARARGDGDRRLRRLRRRLRPGRARHPDAARARRRARLADGRRRERRSRTPSCWSSSATSSCSPRGRIR